MVTKMDMIWISTALLTHPQTENQFLVSRDQIEEKMISEWQMNITSILINKHLVSWEDRQADKKNPSRGGSRNRYLFRTGNGEKPLANGNFRLYKEKDSIYDGWEKTGKSCPSEEDIPEKYHYLLSWYNKEYKLK